MDRTDGVALLRFDTLYIGNEMHEISDENFARALNGIFLYVTAFIDLATAL